MGTLFVLVSPCFRANVVVTCKIGSFLCSLDNLLQKNVFFSFLEIYFYTDANFIVICKPRTLSDGGEDSVQYRNRKKKHCFLAAAIWLFIGKIIIT